MKTEIHPAHMSKGERGQIDGPYSFFVHGLVLQLRPKNVLEIGLGARAYTALSILEAFQAYKSSDPHYYVIDRDDKKAVNYMKDYEGSYSYIGGNGNDKKNYENLPKDLDLVCIDGEHSKNSCIQNVEYSLEKSHSGTIFVFHDALHTQIKEAFEVLENHPIGIRAELGRLKIFSLDTLNIAIGKRVS